MPVRRYTVYLEFSEFEIFYHWNYTPPVPHCRGGVGGVRPGGSMCGIPFDELRLLGDGRHILEFDETKRDPLTKPNFQNEDDRLFREARFELFCERTDTCIAGEPLSTIILAMSPGNVDRITPLLKPTHKDELMAYAKDIAATKAERLQQGHVIFYTGSGSTAIPDANLETIRQRFGSPSQ